MNNTVQRVQEKSLDLEVLIDSISFKKWSSEFNELSSITSFPKRPNMVLLFANNGNVGFYNNSQLIKIFSLKNANGDAIQASLQTSMRCFFAFSIFFFLLFILFIFIYLLLLCLLCLISFYENPAVHTDFSNY